jgi:hypothetical protein
VGVLVGVGFGVGVAVGVGLGVAVGAAGVEQPLHGRLTEGGPPEERLQPAVPTANARTTRNRKAAPRAYMRAAYHDPRGGR